MANSLASHISQDGMSPLESNQDWCSLSLSFNVGKLECSHRVKDDGVFSQGRWSLVDILRKLNEQPAVLKEFPKTEMSSIRLPRLAQPCHERLLTTSLKVLGALLSRKARDGLWKERNWKVCVWALEATTGATVGSRTGVVIVQDLPDGWKGSVFVTTKGCSWSFVTREHGVGAEAWFRGLRQCSDNILSSGTSDEISLGGRVLIFLGILLP
ncbi:hypothetical protein Tco_0785127 [Tanacetum coccineum]